VVRPEHRPAGDPCTRCGAPAGKHRKRAARPRARAAYFKEYNARHGWRASSHERVSRIIAIDGEGYTTPGGAHRYTYLAACDEAGLVRELRAPRGVTAEEVLGFLAELPPSALLVGFALGYDRTKWVESWPDAAVWALLRPEERQGEGGPLPVEVGPYRVNLVSSRMSFHETGDPRTRRTVWDVFKFFQSSFVKALTRWDVGTKRERALIEKEKARRGDFHGIGARERDYCQLECRLLAVLVRRLLQAHEDLGLLLRSYYGPGSSAAIVLKEHGEQRAVTPRAMVEPVLSAYFGGRFEISHVGPVEADELYAYDLRSAYPAAMATLPCLRHGTWVYSKGRDNWREGALALCRVRLPMKGAPEAWGPLPHRMADGNILFPRSGAGGWVWRGEVEAARLLHPRIEVLEAWYWRRGCDCPNPFEARIRELYAARLVWGKEAKGLVLKLVLNSLYGKSAQRVGKSRFKCMVRAGLITSITRAWLLRAVATAVDPWNVLELATDSILSREPLPIETEGLGGWERKAWPGGAMLMRPGLRFALSEELDKTAARGVGVRVLHKNRKKVLAAWEREPMAPVTLETPSFFHGAKLEVRRLLGESTEDEQGFAYRRSEAYGTWSDEERTLRYTPGPKRESVTPSFALSLWELPQGDAFRSIAYGRGGQSTLADELDAMRELEAEQPDHAAVRLL